ncbi:MAG: hypothetical protein JWN15_3532, partial [Firmicutes bacterium]|nr:hypothetical protein [Bacillota bacterium]
MAVNTRFRFARLNALVLAIPLLLSAGVAARAESAPTTAAAPVAPVAIPAPVIPVAIPAPVTPVAIPAPAAPVALLINRVTAPVAPGVTLSSFDRLDQLGWARGYLLTVDLTNPAISADLLYPGAIAAAQPLSKLAARQGAVAGVNGDYFDINGSKAPLSAAVGGGVLLKGPVTGWPHAAGVGTDNVGRLATMALEGTVVLPTGRQALAALNQHIPEDGIGLFTSLWGATTRKFAALWGQGIREVIVRNGRVTAVSDTWGSGEIPTDTFVLIGREKGAAALSGLKVGDPVSVSYAPRTDAAAPFRFAVGGNEVLLQDGAPTAGLDDKGMGPRTAIGFSADGRTMFLLAVDGRSETSGGMTMLGLARFLQQQGAHTALNLDGGGSTSMVARTAGESGVTVTNEPSDGQERSVPNGVGIFTAAGSGKLSGMALRAKYTAEHGDRVFPGLVRTFALSGHDEMYGPAAVPATGDWWVEPPAAGLLLGGGVFVPGAHGPVRIDYSAGGVKASTQLQILGPLNKVITSPEVISLNDGAATFTVAGADADGYTAPIEPANVSFSGYDPNVLTITPTETGAFHIETRAQELSGLVTITVAGKQALLPVSRGTTQTLAADFESLQGWRFSSYPAGVTGELSSVPGRRGQGLRLAYDFTTSQATRAAYADTALTLPGKPESFSLWVKGDGKGARLRTVLGDAAGASYTLDLAQHVTWTDWKYLQVPVPAGVRYPVTINRIYPVETDKAQQYKGELVLDDLVAWGSPVVSAPEQPLPPDPLFVAPGTLGADRWRFAVLSHSLISAATPDSPQTSHARAALQAIAAAKPDFLLVAGDFVAKADAANFELAKQLLSGQPDLPVYYLPGANEAGDLFGSYFPQARRTLDHQGTRVILLNSAAGSLRTSDFAQLAELKASLDDAADNPAVRQVVVVAAHAASQLSDPREAAMVSQWLSEFRQRSGGKGAAYVGGGAGAASAQRIEGVTHVVAGGA